MIKSSFICPDYDNIRQQMKAYGKVVWGVPSVKCFVMDNGAIVKYQVIEPSEN